MREFLLRVIKIGLAVAFLTPLVLGPFGLNMSEYPKAVFFRSLIEIVFVLYVFLLSFNYAYLPRKSLILFSVIAFDAVLIFTSITGINFYRSFFGEMQRGEGIIMHMHLLAFFIMLIGVFVKKTDWRWLFRATVTVSGVSSIAGVLQQTGLYKFYNVGVGRLSGTLSNPDLFGSYLVLSIFLALFLLTLEQNKYFKILWVSLASLNVYTLIFSGTRASWAGFALGVALIFILNYRFLNYKKKIYSLLAVLSISFLLLVFPYFIKSNHLDGTTLGARIVSIYNVEIGNRADLWKISFKAFGEKPFLGWGFESFSYLSDKYFQDRYYKDLYFDRPHNKVMEVLSSGGIIGLLSYLVIFGLIFYQIIKYSRAGETNNTWIKISQSSIIFAFFVSYFVQNIFSFDNVATYILFFLATGFVCNNFISHSVKDFKKFERPVTAGKVILVAVFAVLTGVFLFNLNIKPTIAVMNFNNNIKYEKIDIQKALSEYKKAILMNTVYDPDLVITYVERSIFLLEKGSAVGIGEKVIAPLLSLKLVFYGYIDKNEGGGRRLHEDLIRINEWAYILRKDEGYLTEMGKDIDYAIKYNANIPVFYQLKGEMNILQGKYEEGKKNIKQSCALDSESCKGNEAQLNKLIGIAYYKKEDYKMAVKYFQKTLDFDYEARKNGLSPTIENAPSFIDSVAILYYNRLKDVENCKKAYLRGAETYPEYKNAFAQRLNMLINSVK